ncbi:MAG: hypothetical protein Ct9H90mP20_0300 [Candidatus Neomarinimicrobiota bacterium]|nr:MAG: hypothetical protein Ct9H90mP20_0300 [Candidatus Neomarinimicrobiota bacterium]
MTLDQFMFMRPTISTSQYKTPIANLYLCGSGTHPGVGSMEQMDIMQHKKY